MSTDAARRAKGDEEEEEEEDGSSASVSNASLPSRFPLFFTDAREKREGRPALRRACVSRDLALLLPLPLSFVLDFNECSFEILLLTSPLPTSCRFVGNCSVRAIPFPFFPPAKAMVLRLFFLFLPPLPSPHAL